MLSDGRTYNTVLPILYYNIINNTNLLIIVQTCTYTTEHNIKNKSVLNVYA